jgi:hypothetical protein
MVPDRGAFSAWRLTIDRSFTNQWVVARFCRNWLPVATIPCSDDCGRVWSSRPAEKWQHRLSSRTPTGTELAPRQLIQSANRNPVESNMRRNETNTKSPMKETAKNKP